MINKQKGSTSVWVAIIIIVLIIIGFFFYKNKGSEPVPNQGEQNTLTGETNSNPETSTASTTAGDIVSNVSMNELMAMNKSVKCAFKQGTTNSITEGIVYISDGKIRADSNSSVDGSVINAHMVSDGKDVYVWTDMMKQGMKMTLENSSKQVANPNSPNFDAKLDYVCAPLAADNDMFSIPKDIVFTSLGK